MYICLYIETNDARKKRTRPSYSTAAQAAEERQRARLHPHGPRPPGHALPQTQPHVLRALLDWACRRKAVHAIRALLSVQPHSRTRAPGPTERAAA